MTGLYPGVVTHVRTRPRAHALRYRVVFVAVDLDEPPRTRLFGRGRLFRATPPLSRAEVEAHLTDAGLAHGGRILMLAMPGLLGLRFNPLTVFFCHDRAGGLTAILYEVRNTFGERHAYLIPAGGDQVCGKAFYVSPFMDMDLSYAFRVVPPGDTVGVRIEAADPHGPILTAAFHGRHQPLTDAALLKAWLTHPWMTLGVLAAIHWEALKIWRKGGRVRRRPPPPSHRVTVTPAAKVAAWPRPASIHG
jgi:DUF1365 family protein